MNNPISPPECMDHGDIFAVSHRYFLILSLKYSRGADYLMWFKPDACGYTPNLEKAGRFTHAEAQRRTYGDEKINAMVPIERAYTLAVRPVFVEAGEAMVEKLIGTVTKEEKSP